MKRFFSILIALASVYAVFGQLFVKGSHTKISTAEGIDLIVLFEQIDNASEIHFKSKDAGAVVRWFSLSNGVKQELFNFSKLSSTETYIDPKNETGYILSVDGNETAIWVVDKSKVADEKEIMYEDAAGVRKNVSAQYSSTVHQQEQKAISRVAESFNQEIDDEIGCKITTETSVRESKNENQRPDASTLEGSAPLEIQFYSNPEGNVQNFLWNIYKDGSLIVTRTEQNHQYTFTETGKYKITLQVTSGLLSASDSVEVSIAESKIAAPKVFTPNGDGFNDEFRVAYTSITDFQGTILNRWGRVVFSWTNPQIGWDGNINGKPAPEGTYFYVIKAKGSDGIPYLLKGHTNLLR